MKNYSYNDDPIQCRPHFSAMRATKLDLSFFGLAAPLS